MGSLAGGMHALCKSVERPILIYRMDFWVIGGERAEDFKKEIKSDGGGVVLKLFSPSQSHIFETPFQFTQLAMPSILPFP